MISNKVYLDVETGRKAYCLRVKPLVYEAFERLCEVYGFQRVNVVVETMMLACVRNEGLFTLLTYGKLRETRKRRKKRVGARALEEKLREMGELKESELPGNLESQVKRLRLKLEQLRRERMQTPV